MRKRVQEAMGMPVGDKESGKEPEGDKTHRFNAPAGYTCQELRRRRKQKKHGRKVSSEETIYSGYRKEGFRGEGI